MADDKKLCGAWPQYGGCVLPSHHNLGRVDIPSRHQFPERAEADDPYMAHIRRLEKEIEALRKAFGLLVVSAEPAVKWLDAMMESIREERDHDG